MLQIMLNQLMITGQQLPTDHVEPNVCDGIKYLYVI
jgi:hypothetical protein